MEKMKEKIMHIFSDTVEDFYNSIDENERLKRKNSNKIEFITTTEYLNKCIMPNSLILDACAGGGIYSFYFSDKGHQVYAGDLVEKNVEEIRRNQENHKKLKDIYVGSILNLNKYDNEAFDVVLNLGSHYHLTEDIERERSLEESTRVLKTGGIYALAYVNRYSNIIKFRKMFTDDIELMDEYCEKGYHSKNTVFYCTTPELVEKELLAHKLEILHHVAADGMKFVLADVINELTEDKFNRWMEFHLKTCEDRSNLGSSEHGLIIARKI